MPRTAPASFNKPMQPSPALAAVIGDEPVSRPEATKKLWVYIKANNLQDEVERRTIHADDLLRPVFGGQEFVTMFQLPNCLGKNLSKIAEG